MTNKKQITKNQHYVPELYLKEWIVDGHANVWNKENNKIERIGHKKLCSEKYFYETIDKNNLKRYDIYELNYIENYLNKLETVENRLLSKIKEDLHCHLLCNYTLDEKEKNEIKELFSYFIFRSKAMRKKFVQSAIEAGYLNSNQIKDMKLKERELQADFLSNKNYIEKVISLIFNEHDILFVKTTPDKSFLTSYFPCSIGKNVYGEFIILAMPISPLLAIMFINKNCHNHKDGDVLFVGKTNLHHNLFFIGDMNDENIISKDKDNLVKYKNKMSNLTNEDKIKDRAEFFEFIGYKKY